MITLKNVTKIMDNNVILDNINLNLEEGKREEFKDVVFLKYFIRDYAKYLGLNSDELVDEFNEFLFDYTSKLSLDDIKKAKKQVENKEKKEEKKIVSPYTYERKNRTKISPIVLYIMLVLIVAVSCYFVINKIDNNNNTNENTTENVIK